LDRALGLGILLQLGWVVSIGGDFMSGRFLTLPLLAAVVIVARRDFGNTRIVLAIVSVLLGALAPRASWRMQPSAAATLDFAGVADERAFYLAATGLGARLRSGPDIDHRARREAVELRAKNVPSLSRLSKLGCGIYGYYAGPDVHIVDEWALTDPLLARLPAMRQLHWRIGHFPRAIPPGYLKTLASGQMQLRDPALAQYWRALALVVRGLCSLRRAGKRSLRSRSRHRRPPARTACSSMPTLALPLRPASGRKRKSRSTCATLAPLSSQRRQTRLLP
jgi:arabinofuranosyltransferase